MIESSCNLPRSEKTNSRPYDYFVIQAEFAQKMADITSQPFFLSLTINTAIHRLIYDKIPNKNHIETSWLTLISKASKEKGINLITKIFYEAYLSSKHDTKHLSDGLNEDGKIFGPFDFVYNNEKKIIFLHISPNKIDQNGENGFQSFREYKKQFKKMFMYLNIAHSDAETVSARSWLLYKPQESPLYFEKILPQRFIKNIQDLPPYRHALSGEDIWGQFINRTGINTIATQTFRDRFSRAETVDELISSFPHNIKVSSDKASNFFKLLKSYS